MSPVTSALIDYWHRLPAEPVASRRERLRTVVAEARAGRVAATALVPYALGDHDPEIVAAATTAYVDSCLAPDARRAALDDACEWIRRGLALNRGAVFAALLRTGDETTLASLARQRLALQPTEVGTICRRVARFVGSRRVRRFVDDWLALIADAEHPDLVRQRELLIGVAAWRTARPRAVA